MRIPQYFGQATDILYYSSKCQFESIEYYKRIKKVNGIQALQFDGDTDYIVAKFDTKTGWFPQVGSTFFLKFLLPKNTDMFSKNFGVFGSGDMTDIEDNDFWGLSVRTDPSSRKKNFYLTVSNTLQMYDIPFTGFVFEPGNFQVNQFNTITLLQNSTYAHLYINGLLVSKVNLPFIPETNKIYKNIYIGSFGKTTEYPGMKMFVKEIGLWERPIEPRDVFDLHQKNFIENKGVSKKSKRIKIDAGKFYYDGYIHSINDTSIFINGEGTETIYILIKETLVTEAEDPELLDNSANTYNLGKPGMHRIKYEYSYATNIDTATLPEGTYAIKFLEFIDGNKTFSLLKNDTVVPQPKPNPSNPDPNKDHELGGNEIQIPSSNKDLIELISKYLYEMLGNFIYSGINVSMLDKNTTQYQIAIGAGVYYLNGKRYELDKSLYLDVSKTASLTSIVNEYIKVETNKPILLAQQPVAARYMAGNNTLSGITRVLVPTKQRKDVHVSRTDPNGEDIVDASAVKVLNVYKGTSLATASVVYKPCSTIDGTDGDYYFYNGRIKWSPHSLNKPRPAVNGISVDTYVVEYVKLYSCIEGLDYDFVMIKGDKLADELIQYKGKHINHSLQYKSEYLISAKVTKGSNTYTFNIDDIIIDGNNFKIEKDIGFLDPGDIIEIHYSYNSNQTVKPFWHILFFETASKEIVSSVDGIIDYKYYLSDIYTLAIDTDNVFRLYRGIPGFRGNAIRSAIPDTSLPIADIIIDPDGSKYCKVTPYGIYKTHVIDIRNLMKKVSGIETNIALSELEKIGESKADLNKLRGMFVDPLSNYSRSDVTGHFNAFIDLVRERLYSGFDRSSVLLSAQDSANIRIGKEVLFPISTDATTVIDAQISDTGEDIVNKVLLSEAKAQVTVYNDSIYDQELKTVYTKNALESIQQSPITLIPSNSDTSVFNTESSEGTVSDRSTYIKKVLDRFNVFFADGTLSSVIRDRVIVLEGKGFNPGESDITLKIGDKTVSPDLVTALAVDRTDPANPKVVVNEDFTDKRIKISNLQFFSGWSANPSTGIKANDKGEFVVKVQLPYSLNILTGFQTLTVERYSNKNDPIKVGLNFSGLLDSVQNVINTGSRGNITFYDSPKYSVDYVPGIIQPINSETATIIGINLFFSYIDYSLPIIIDFYEMTGTSIKKVLHRRNVYTISDFDKVSDGKYFIKFDSPVNIIRSKSYAIGISTENSAVRLKISEIGKQSRNKVDLNVIVSKVNSLLTIVGKNNNNLIVNSDGKKGIVYELLALDNTLVPKNQAGLVENIIRFDTVEFGDFQDRFTLFCDFDPTLGFDRKISVEYSIEARDIADNTRKWVKFVPYTMVTTKEKFKSLTVRFILSSGNVNYVPSIPQYPLIYTYKFKPKSSYYSKWFETGIEDGSGETNIDLYFNAELRAGSDYSIKVSPDSGMSWRECGLVESKVTGTTSYLVLKEEKYRYECRLMPPVILGHEIIPAIPGNLDNGKFDSSMIVSYLVALLDANGNALNIKELYNINETTRLPEVYSVVNLNGLDQKIKLKIKIDSNCKGFRIYRSMNGSPTFNQIYSSIALTTVPSSLSPDDIDQYKIPAANILEFPRTGILKINTELIHYDSISGNLFMVSDNGRGYYNSTVNKIKPGDKIELFDYANGHENILKGQVPRIYDTKQFFEFVDDNKTYTPFSSRIPVSEDKRALNETISYPTHLSVRLDFDNSNNVTESSNLFNLICNVEKKS